MRVSTNQTQQVAIDAMIDQQEKLLHVQKQVATGRRIFKPSDDPVAAARIVDLKDLLQTTNQYQTNIDAARARLSIEESVLSGVSEVLQRVRELSIAANNASQTNETRKFISEEVEQLLGEVLDLSNNTDSTGNFLFAGSKNKFRPFVMNANGEFDYHGDSTQMSLQIGPKRVLSTNDSGNFVFRTIKDGNGEYLAFDNEKNIGSGIIDQGSATGTFDGNTYAIIFNREEAPPGMTGDMTYKVTDSNGNVAIPAGTSYASGAAIEFNGTRVSIAGEVAEGDFFVIRPSQNKDIFTTIKEMVDVLRVPRGSPRAHAELHNTMNRVIVGMDQSLGRVLEARSNVGARLNALDNQENINEDYRVQVKEILSDIEDLDYAEAVSRLNLRLTGLEASQKAFTKIQGITMFDYL